MLNDNIVYDVVMTELTTLFNALLSGLDSIVITPTQRKDAARIATDSMTALIGILNNSRIGFFSVKSHGLYHTLNCDHKVLEKAARKHPS